MTLLLATYVHHLDPFAVQFTETFGIRWYGLAYVAGFLAAFLLLRWFVRLGICDLKEEQVSDFIAVGAIGGVMIGGRLGYMLLYNTAEFFHNPLSFFDFMGGGMASHGGFAGLAIATWAYAKWAKKSWLGLGDNLATVCPLGLFFGRVANFINGELYGRPTESALAMKFPDELLEGERTANGNYRWDFPTESLRELAASSADVAPALAQKVEAAWTAAIASGYDAHFSIVGLIRDASMENPAFRERLGEILTPRHPSQLYEGIVEGLLLFLVLLAVRLKWRNLYHGILSGLFFVLYAIGRISVEIFREPDSEMIAGLTKGQFYSVFMIGIGIIFIAYGFIRKRQDPIASGSA